MSTKIIKNKIPRKFNEMKIKMLRDTSCDQQGDIIRMYKNDNGYLALNERTGKYACAFGDMLRNAEMCEILEIV